MAPKIAFLWKQFSDYVEGIEFMCALCNVTESDSVRFLQSQILNLKWKAKVNFSASAHPELWLTEKKIKLSQVWEH